MPPLFFIAVALGVVAILFPERAAKTAPKKDGSNELAQPLETSVGGTGGNEGGQQRPTTQSGGGVIPEPSNPPDNPA